MFKTYTAKPDSLTREWYLIDATGKTLGRLASEIALRLRGKHKPEFTPNMDVCDYIVVINADKINVSGKKNKDKVYYRHTGYIGNLKHANFHDMQIKRPGKVLEIAVKGMLPRGPLGRSVLNKLKIYAGESHKHEAQQPINLEI